jgi:RNA-binding protein
MEPLANPEIRKLKALAQRLEPVLRVGKQGLTDAFVQSVEAALAQHELIKVKFAALKDQKKELAPVLAARTSSHLIARVGNVAVLYRVQPDAAKRKV